MKKKVALSATAIAVLASTIPTHVAPVEAAGNTIYVDFSNASGNDDTTGAGTDTTPYKQLYMAVDAAQDGDTIIIRNKGYVNDLWSDTPWVINKKVTIRGEGKTPPNLSVRCPGIVLGKDVKFEFVDLTLYNSSHAYMYANGHKLELINTTFSGNNQPLKLYAGAKSGSDLTGTLGSVVVKTDSGFIGNGKTANIDAIYAGGDSGTTDLPASITVHQGASNSISLKDVDGTGLTSNMDVTLFNSSPQVNGGLGANTLSTGTSDSREVNMSNIHNLNITQGTIELNNDSIPSVDNVNIASGAILDLRERWTDLTIGTYTGQGGIALEPDGYKVDVTNFIDTSNSLSVYLGTYNTIFNTNGGYTKDFTYVTTANNNARVQLYGDNNTFSNGYNFIPVSNEGRFEWKVAKPAEEGGESQTPAITEITVTDGNDTQTSKLSDYTTNPAHEVYYDLGVATNSGNEKEEVWLTDFKDDLVITVNGKATERFGEDNDYISYYSEEEEVDIYLEPGSTPRTQRVAVSFRDAEGNYVEPEKSKYEIQIGTKDIQPVTLTLNVEGIEAPDGEEGGEQSRPIISQFNVYNATQNVDANSEFSVEYPFIVVGTKGETDIDLSKYRLSFNFDNDETLNYSGSGERSFKDYDVTVKVEKADGDNAYKLIVTGNSSELGKGNHPLKMSVLNGQATTTFNLIVEEASSTTPVVTKPTVNGVIFPEDVKTAKAKLSQVPTFINLPFNLSFTNGTTEPVGFETLGYTLTINDKPAVYNQSTTLYHVQGESVALQIVPRGNGRYQAVLVNIVEGNVRAVLPAGTFKIKAVGPVSFNFQFDVEDDTKPATPPTGGGNTGGSSTGGGTGTVTPPSQEEVKPTPVPPVTEEVTNRVDKMEHLTVEFQQKVDSLMTDIDIQENGTIIDLVGDNDDLSNVDTLELTPEGLFINLDGEKVKFNTELDLSNIDWDNTRVIRVGGGAVPHKQNGEGLTITTPNFSNLLITSREPEPFDDVNDDDWYKQYVEDAYNYGFTTGTTATTFSPNDTMTRAQLAVMIARAYELQPTSDEPTLSDTSDKWYADEVQALVDAGIIKGYVDGTFGGEDTLTRQQIALILARTLETVNKDVAHPSKEELGTVQIDGLDNVSEEASDAIRLLALREAINSGEGVNYNPHNTATRAQVVKMVTNTARLSGMY